MRGQQVTIDALLADSNHLIAVSTSDGVLNDEIYDAQFNYMIENWEAEGKHLPGFFHLRGWNENTPRNRARIKKVFSHTEGDIGISQIDINTEGGKKLKDRFDAGLQGSYASVYKNLVGGARMFEDIKNTAWHVFKQYYNDGESNADIALQQTFTLLFGDTLLERNGGIEFPNGIGLWHDKGKMAEYNLTLQELEEYKVNVFYQLINHQRKGDKGQLQFQAHVDDNMHWDEVAQGIIDGGGNIWWGVINDIKTDGYRIVLMAQRGDKEASLAEAAIRSYSTPGSKVPGIEILGDAYFNDGTGAKPIRLTKDQYFKAIAEAPAAEALYSSMDWWDRLFLLANKDRRLQKEIGYGRDGGRPETWNILEEQGTIQPGPDLSRKRIKYYIDKYGEGTEHYSKTPRAWSFFGTGWGLDWSKPGKLEMDLVWIPLWNDIRELEKKTGGRPDSGKMEREITQDELVNLFRQRYRSMFKGRSDHGLQRMFSVYDMLHIMEGPRYRTLTRPQDMTESQLRGLVNVSGAEN